MCNMIDIEVSWASSFHTLPSQICSRTARASLACQSYLLYCPCCSLAGGHPRKTLLSAG